MNVFFSYFVDVNSCLDSWTWIRVCASIKLTHFSYQIKGTDEPLPWLIDSRKTSHFNLERDLYYIILYHIILIVNSSYTSPGSPSPAVANE